MIKQDVIEEVVGKVAGFPLYEITSYGRVINIESGYEMTPRQDKNGYYVVKLSNNGVKRCFYLHRLVAMVFLRDFEHGINVEHRNGIKSDNAALNLEMGKKRVRRPE